MRSVKDIKPDRLVEITNRIKSEFGGIISKYQSLLDKSESKEEDFVIIDFAMEDIMNEMYDKFDYDDYEAIFMDAEAALMPMPEGVVNQTANILFNPKHLEILTDCNPISGATFSLEESSLYPNVEEGIKEAREHVGEMFSVEDSKKVRDKDTYDYEVHIMLKEPDENLDKKVLNDFLFEYFGLDDEDFFGYDSESGMIGLATDKKRITKDELKEAFTKFIKKNVEDASIDEAQSIIDKAKRLAKELGLDVKVLGRVQTNECVVDTFPEDFDKMVKLFSNHFDVYDIDKEFERFKIREKEISDSVEEASPKKVVATCETQKTRDGFKHIVRVIVDDKVYEGVVGYINRTWEAYDYQTALIKAIKEMKLFNEDEISDLYKLDSFESVIEEVKKRV